MELTWANFPDHLRAEAFHALGWARERWRVLAGVAAALVLAGAGAGVWAWHAQRREGEAARALAEVNLAFRKQYPSGFYLPGGDGAEPRPDDLIRRYHEVADRYEGTRAALEARLRGAHLEYGAGQYDGALRSYDRYLQAGGTALRAVALLGKGYALLAKGDGPGAVAAFRAAAEAAGRDPLAAEAYMAQGRVLETLNKKDEALKAYGAVTERFGQTAWAVQATERITSLK